MTSVPRYSLLARVRKAAPMALAVALGLASTHCASLRIKPPVETVYVRPSERLFFRVAPFDSVVKAELARAGLDPVRFEEEFNAEVRYRFNVRKQEEAQDSAGALVVLTATIRHLQPGVGNAGTYGEFEVAGRRRKDPVFVAWKWELPSSQNKPAEMLSRDLTRGAAEQLMLRVRKAPPRPKEPPPPLQLL
jgi:hypothetical protein